MENSFVLEIGGYKRIDGRWYFETKDPEGLGQSFHDTLEEVRAEAIAQVTAMFDSLRDHQEA